MFLLFMEIDGSEDSSFGCLVLRLSDSPPAAIRECLLCRLDPIHLPVSDVLLYIPLGEQHRQTNAGFEHIAALCNVVFVRRGIVVQTMELTGLPFQMVAVADLDRL
jgi:hypothetical protein